MLCLVLMEVAIITLFKRLFILKQGRTELSFYLKAWGSSGVFQELGQSSNEIRYIKMVVCSSSSVYDDTYDDTYICNGMLHILLPLHVDDSVQMSSSWFTVFLIYGIRYKYQSGMATRIPTQSMDIK